ncbi:MAG: hypothetical protein ACI835_001365 [Planctomycetota bacterium]|jgi:hypothetical protein
MPKSMGGRREHLQGFGLAVFRAGDLITSALGKMVGTCLS